MDHHTETARLHVEFFSEPVENKRKSADAGRPVFDEKEFVRIRFPGDNKRVLVAPANAHSINHPETGMPMTYIERFPDHYAAFQRMEAAFVDGTPLAEAPFISRTRAAELKALDIHTVEALAALNEQTFKRVGMDARTLRDEAAAWLDKASGAAGITKLADENAALRSRVAEMEKMLKTVVAERQPEPEPEPENIPMDRNERDDEVVDPEALEMRQTIPEPQIVTEREIDAAIRRAEFDTWSKNDLIDYIYDAVGDAVSPSKRKPELVRLAGEAMRKAYRMRAADQAA